MLTSKDLTLDFDSFFANAPDSVGDALAIIKQEGLNRFRCSLTGAPYATIDDDEIRLALSTELEAADKNMTAENLADRWQIRALVINSSPCPALRNANRLTLRHMANLPQGDVRVVTYCLSRLFFPAQAEGRGLYTNSTRAIARMVFAAGLYDSLVEMESNGADWIKVLIQQLTACDSYSSLSTWLRIPLLNAKRAKEGLHAPKNKDVAGWFAEPDSFEVTQANLMRVSHFLMGVMCELAVKHYDTLATGDRLAATIFTAQADAIPVPATTPTQKSKRSKQSTSPADLAAENPDWYNTLNAAAQTRVAWSATHGIGVKMRDSKPPRKAAKDKPKSIKPKKAKTYKNPKTQAQMNALNSINIDFDL